MKNAWVWLSTRKDLKDRDLRAVLMHFGDPESVFRASEQDYRQVPEMTEKGIKSLMDKSMAQPEEILRRCVKEKIHVLTWQDEAYPSRLKGIADPPLVLYYKGTLPNMEAMPCIGAVGTRSFSDYGMEMARQLGYQLAQGGAAVVSGMAEGIDAGVISGALAANGIVIGFLGSGVDVVYPASNARLYEAVLQRGCLISEYPPGTRPYRWNFPKRNRLISGISNGVLVVEAPERSGALITARQAAEQGRDIYAVPGNANTPSCRGSNQLLQDGAILVNTGWDILEFYQYRYPCVVPPAQAAPTGRARKTMMEFSAAPPRPLEKKAKQSVPKKKKMIDNPVAPPYIDVEKKTDSLSEEEKRIVNQLISGSRLKDDVIQNAGLPTAKAMSLLTMLEIKGIIHRLPGNLIALREE